MGFGKTEVAMRAAFSGAIRQTGCHLSAHHSTCQQHCENFADRFADWPVNVALYPDLQLASALNKH